jgi:hypothetical protein
MFIQKKMSSMIFILHYLALGLVNTHYGRFLKQELIVFKYGHLLGPLSQSSFVCIIQSS